MKIELDWPIKYWAKLQQELEPLREDSLLVDMFCEQISPLLYTSEEILFLQIYEFQVKNGQSPLVLNTSRQMQKYKGGASLSQQVHQSSRGSSHLSFKKRYTAFAKYLAAKTNPKEDL